MFLMNGKIALRLYALSTTYVMFLMIKYLKHWTENWSEVVISAWFKGPPEALFENDPCTLNFEKMKWITIKQQYLHVKTCYVLLVIVCDVLPCFS